MNEEYEKNINETPEQDGQYRWKPESPEQGRWQQESAPRYDEPQQESTPRYQEKPQEGAPRYEEPRREEKPDPPKKKKGGKRIVALALVCALIGGLFGAGGAIAAYEIMDEFDDDDDRRPGVSGVLQGLRENTVIKIEDIDTSKIMTPAEVYAANVNSTVFIITTIYTGSGRFQTTATAYGSGFVLTPDGYILTNHHVIEDASKVEVEFFDGKRYDAKIIGYEAQHDIAVLKINAKELAPVILGDSDNLNVGDSVVAIGNPLGDLTFTLTAGLISAKERSVRLNSGITMKLLQTDCAINSGNSGGPLFNLYGEVIGITNAKSSGTGSSTEASIDNLGFAIPIKQVKEMVFSIIEKGYVAKPYVGITVSTTTAQMQYWGAPQGALVESVEAEGPADKAGLKANDIITHVNEKAITTHTELVNIIGEMKVGDEVELTVYRNKETVKITVTIGESIQSAIE